MGFQQGLSGLNAASKALDTISHNIANAATVGYKAQTTTFADIYAGAMSGGAAQNQVGLGVNVSGVSTTFSQGALSASSNPLDMAINGDGFFMISNNGAPAYTRDGQFHVNTLGQLVTVGEDQVLGFGINSAGQVLPGQAQPLILSKAPMSPNQTDTSTINVNLDTRATVPSAAWTTATSGPYSPNTDSYNYTMSQTIYDSQGSGHNLELYYAKTGANSWNVYATVDGSQPSNIDLGAGMGNPLALSFDSSGQLISPTTTTFNINTAGVAADVGTTFPSGGVWTINNTLTGTTQIASTSAVLKSTQNGNAPGVWTGWTVDSQGRIQGSYSNGQLSWVGQVSLARFENPNGLVHLGDNLYAETYDSGAALVGSANTGSLGAIQNNMTEDSTVDLTKSMVDMITQQRNYQANAQVIKTQDALIQTLLNIR